MITTTFNGHTLEIYDSIDELPINRFMVYNRNAMIDAGVGSDVNSYVEHTRSVRKFLELGEKGKADQELENMETNIYFILSQSNPAFLSFFALIKSFNGRELTDLEVFNPEKLQLELSKKGFSIGKLKGLLSRVKKKFDQEFEIFLTSIAGISQMKRKTLLLRERALHVLDQIITGSNKTVEISAVEKMIFEYYKPQVFGGEKGLEARAIIDFEDTCNILEQIGFTNPRKMSTLSFFRALTQLKKQNGKDKGK